MDSQVELATMDEKVEVKYQIMGDKENINQIPYKSLFICLNKFLFPIFVSVFVVNIVLVLVYNPYQYSLVSATILAISVASVRWDCILTHELLNYVLQYQLSNDFQNYYIYFVVVKFGLIIGLLILELTTPNVPILFALIYNCVFYASYLVCFLLYNSAKY